MKHVFIIVLFAISIHAESVIMSSINPEYSAQVKTFVIDTVYEVFQPSICKEMFQKQLDEIEEFYDIEHSDEVYLNNGGMFIIITNHNSTIIGTGALKKLDSTTAELKRMWLSKEYRGRCIASQIIDQLYKFAKSCGYTKIKLEMWQPEKQQRALHFYKKNGFYEIERYHESPAQLFMEKTIG